MARLLRIENCYQCPHIISRYRTPGMGCMQVRDENGEPSDLGGGCSGTPDWCPLPEAKDGGWVPVEDALPEPDTMVEVILVVNLEHFDERVPESHWIDVHARWIATRRWDAPQCGRDPGGWEFVNRVGERWDVRAVVVWRELPPLGREWEERMAEDSRIVGEICGWERESEAEEATDEDCR